MANLAEKFSGSLDDECLEESAGAEFTDIRNLSRSRRHVHSMAGCFTRFNLASEKCAPNMGGVMPGAFSVKFAPALMLGAAAVSSLGDCRQ